MKFFEKLEDLKPEKREKELHVLPPEVPGEHWRRS